MIDYGCKAVAKFASRQGANRDPRCREADFVARHVPWFAASLGHQWRRSRGLRPVYPLMSVITPLRISSSEMRKTST
jgi:hypothetical protein